MFSFICVFIFRFVSHLQAKRLKVTTQRIYLLDAIAFLNYLSNMTPPGVKLSNKDMMALKVEIKARLKDIGRDIVGHRLSVRRNKSSKILAYI